MSEETTQRVVAVNRGAEQADGQGPGRGPRQVLRRALGHGRIGEFNVGGTEIIGYDEPSGGYTSHFYDSQGNVTVSRLVADGDTWTYLGETTRSTVEFSDGYRVQTVLHERTDDGATFKPSMKVTLIKVD